jgi:hypothetical protein
MSIHTCSYYCERPECIRAQRDELRQKLEQAEKQEPVVFHVHKSAIKGEEHMKKITVVCHKDHSHGYEDFEGKCLLCVVDDLMLEIGNLMIQKRRAEKREWVSLTDEEIKEIIGSWGPTPIRGYTRKLFDQIEAKLKEKNT